MLGGGRVAPNPSTQVNVYNPATDTWSTAPPMTTARRNFAADIDPQAARIFAAGGYDTTGTTLVALNDQFTCTVLATAVALAVDAAGNGVYQPNETVVVAPSWMNTGATAMALTGAFTNHTGPAGATYTIPDGAADYGTVAAGATASCTAPRTATAWPTPPRRVRAVHWDSTAAGDREPRRDRQDVDAPHRRQLHRRAGEQRLLPVRRDDPPQERHRRLHRDRRTARPTPRPVIRWRCSCSCPRSRPATPRPPAAPRRMFTDVPVDQPLLPLDRRAGPPRRRRRLRRRQLLPDGPATREQMAVFVLRTLDPTLNPPACAPPNLFLDVPATSPFCRWIEELARRGVVTGCGGGNYCPTAPVTREQMSVFLAVTFGLTLYGL